MSVMNPLRCSVLLSCLLVAACASHPSSHAAANGTRQATVDAALQAAVDGAGRKAENRARDGARHPLQTLQFFGIAPTQTVVEITPGAGWYTEILAPYLRDHGRYVAAVTDPARTNTQLASDPALYGKATVVEFDAKAPVFGPPASADAVLTFRNVHNWVGNGSAQGFFDAFHAVLKPGGVLGVVDHRAKPGTDAATMKKSGYVTEALVIDMATRAGFVLEAKSEINANPRDDAHHPNGVWTLPPSNRHDAEDRASYQAIGESDRMTLRFRKPG